MALMMAISFPAFGTHDQLLYSKTKSKIVQKLRGKHGFKRFARDGFGTVLEDSSERFYKDSTVQVPNGGRTRGGVACGGEVEGVLL